MLEPESISKQPQKDNHPALEAALVRHGQRVTITKPEGVYTIIYGGHLTTQDAKLLPAKFDAAVVETGGDQWINNPLELLNIYRQDIQYKPLFEKAEENRIPVFFLDSFYQFTRNPLADVMITLLADNIASIPEAIIGGKLILDLAEAIKNNQVCSRRNLLTAPVKAIAGTYLSSPFISFIARNVSTFSDFGTEATAETAKLTARAHPEIALLMGKARNVGAAYKQQRFMEYWRNGSHFVDVWGASHVGIEDEIQTSLQAKYDFLKGISPMLKLIADPAFYRAAKFDYNGKDWQITTMYELPELKQLVTEA